MYWWEQPKQLSLDSQRHRVCLACRTLDPPTEPAYGCPECRDGGTLDYYDGEIPKVCPSYGEGKLELITESACGECGQGEIEDRDVYPCPYCGHIRLSTYDYHSCPNRPRDVVVVATERRDTWTPQSGEGKVAYLRLECRAKEERVKVNGRFCPGWRRLVERYYAGDKDAFRDCIFCAYGWGRNPGVVEATGTEPYAHQTVLKV